MNNLDKEVNKLFKDYPHTPKVMEFKDELLSNLEAKVEDLVANGVDKNKAIQQSINDVKGFVIDGIAEFNIIEYKTETAQLAFIYSLVGLILTIPLMLYDFGRTLNFGVFAITLGFGIRYMGFKSGIGKLNDKIIVDVQKVISTRKLVWILWSILFSVMVLLTTAVQFSSNLWFGTPIKVNGPYAFGALLAKYYIPLITIIIPMYFNSLVKLITNIKGDETNAF